MRFQRSKSSLFLMEIILNILLFSVLLVVGLQFFIKTHLLTRETFALQEAVTCSSNIASIYQSGDGSLDVVKEHYPNAVVVRDQLFIYFNENFSECSKEESSYSSTVSLLQSKNINTVNITIYTKEHEELYSLDVSHLTLSSPSSQEV